MEIIPPTIFFLIAFTLLMTTERLILQEYAIPLSGFGMAFIGALIAGKVVLLADLLPFVNKFPDKPLLYNVIWKTIIYFSAAMVVRYIEHLSHFLLLHEGFKEANLHLLEKIVWPHFWLVQMWLAVLFFIYCSIRELVRAIGKEKVMHMYFGFKLI